MSTEAAQILDSQASTPPPQADPGATPPAKESTGAPKETAGSEPVSGKLEILIRREQQALARERMAKQREAELEEKLKRLTEFESVKTNPKKALELLGLNYDELTQSILKDGEIPPSVEIKRLRDELEQFKNSSKQQQEQYLEEQKRRAQEQEQRAVQDFKSEITTYLGENKERYELIAFEGAEDLVYDVIDEHYNRTINPETGIGEVKPIAWAADKVEEHLEKKYQKAKDVSKVNALWAKIPGLQAKVEQIQAMRGQTPRTTTLTNTLTATPAKPRSSPLTDEERVAKAIAYAKGLRP